MYFHIPFCRQKCNYCDFLSAPAGEQVQNAYMEALLRETEAGSGMARDRVVRSVFIGGGTPSVVDTVRLCRVLDLVRRRFDLAADAEITVEINPGTVTERDLKDYREAGINRLSIGCQSADDRELAFLGRIHDYSRFEDTCRMARDAGFDNINVDLISALPGQTLEEWEKNLRTVLSLSPAPEHLSVYSLILEEGTVFWERYEKGMLEPVDEDLERDMYWRTARILREAGYEHYEISNYARPGYRCRHNCGYWQRTDYLGFGIGAASLLDNVRFRNGESLQGYLSDPLGCRQDREELTAQEQMAETMFLGLRMADGVSLSVFQDTYGADAEEIYRDAIEGSCREGLLAVQDGRIFLTKRGVDLANYVMAKFV